MARERDDVGTPSGEPPRTNERTTVDAERARREERERYQREHPDDLAGRGREPRRDEPIDADDDSERFRARENEDRSEG